MIRKIVLSVLLLASLVSLKAEEMNILFMGNSFTFRHDLPELVKEVFEEGQSDLSVNVERLVYGGQDMFRHHDLYFSETTVRLNTIKASEVEEKIDKIQSMLDAGKAPDFYGAYWKKAGLTPFPWSKVEKNLKNALNKQKTLLTRVKEGDRLKWDYLVLQSWRDVVPDVDAGYAEYAQKFAKLAEKEGIKVILYITAPRAQNAEPVTEPLELAQTKMEMKTVQQLKERIQPHAVVPVALGINHIQKGGTDLKFRYVNDGHPNQYSAFLAANMFYAAFFKKSTEGFQFDTVVETKVSKGKNPDGGELKVVFDDETKTLLQKAAFDAVKEFDAASAK